MRHEVPRTKELKSDEQLSGELLELLDKIGFNRVVYCCSV
jgi:hypothetical protein